MIRENLFVVAFVVVGLLSTPVSKAATRYVDGSTGIDSGNCQNAGAPCASVGYALGVALPDDVIRIADGIYTETLTIDQSVTLEGGSRAGTVIQGSVDAFQGDLGSNDGRVIDTTTTVTSLTLRDLTLRHGNAVSGGAIYAEGTDLTLERVLLEKNRVSGVGGAIRSDDNVTVLSEVILRENLSGQPDGNGVGGGLRSRDGDLTLTDVRFENNESGGGGGGAMWIRDSVATLTRTTFIGNSTAGAGGGLLNYGSSPVMSNVEFRANSAGDEGGAIYNLFDSAPTIVNGLISGNFATSRGGGIANQSTGSQPRLLTNVTITGNRALDSRGGGIFKPANTELRNTIIWNNRDVNGQGGPTSAVSDFFSGDLTVNSSLVQGYADDEFNGSGALDGTDASNDPLFLAPVGPVAAPTAAGDLHLDEGSPMIDAGEDAFISGFSTDLDGLDRIVGSSVDLGPYETGNDVLFSDRFEQ